MMLYSPSLILLSLWCTYAQITTAVYICANLTLYQGIAEVTTFTVINSTSIPSSNSTDAFCYVQAVIGGRINAWLMLPETDAWNSRFIQYGCGGSCGVNSLLTLDTATPVNAGFAISTTDMGNEGDGSFYPFYNNLQTKIDWGYQATHLTAIASKMLILAYYGQDPEYSYHIGSSTGGRQGLVEAQRFPGEFDGIIAIAPALNETGITTYQMSWNVAACVPNCTATTVPVVSADDAAVIQAAVLAACDAQDGLIDGIVSNPRACSFNLSALACPTGTVNATESKCLIPESLAGARAIYEGPQNSAGIYLTLEGLLPASEAAWPGAICPEDGVEAGFYGFAGGFLSYYAFSPDPATPIPAFNFSMNTPILETSYIENLEYGGIADLHNFKQLGGKLIMTGGLRDPAVPPSFVTDYYLRTITAMGGYYTTIDFFRFFQMPGVNHVSGGPGPDTWDQIGTISAWVENGTAPDEIIFSHLTDDVVDYNRPLYPYPFLSYYKGTGNGSSSEGFYPFNSTAGFRGYNVY